MRRAGKLALLLWAWGAPAAAAPVHVLVFEAPGCPHCEQVEREVLAPLVQAHGAQVVLHSLSVRRPAAYEVLMRLEARQAVAPAARRLPTVAVGDRLLVGASAVLETLPGLVQEGLTRGGAPLPEVEGLDAALAAPSRPPGGLGDLFAEGCDDEGCGVQAPIWAAYFYQVGCQACSRTEVDLAYLRQRQPRLVVEAHNVYAELELALWLTRRAGRDDFRTPAVFIGDRALIGPDEVSAEALAAAVATAAPARAPRSWAGQGAEASGDLLGRFRRLGPAAVVVAGLIDGVNPCAFATMVFFVSYLAVGRRRGRQILAVGAAFTAGVFLAYLAVGLGLHQLLDLMGGWLTRLGRWMVGATALLCLGLAVASLYDFVQARRGGLKDMAFVLPEALRARIHAQIRRRARLEAYVAGAFVTGLVVSLLELACTGQVYLPTIIFVTALPELRARAVAYLVLYNVMFIVPLVVVFVLAYYGTTSKQMQAALQRRAAGVKLGMAVMFMALAGWLASTLV